MIMMRTTAMMTMILAEVSTSEVSEGKLEVSQQRQPGGEGVQGHQEQVGHQPVHPQYSQISKLFYICHKLNMRIRSLFRRDWMNFFLLILIWSPALSSIFRDSPHPWSIWSPWPSLHTWSPLPELLPPSSSVVIFFYALYLNWATFTLHMQWGSSGIVMWCDVIINIINIIIMIDNMQGRGPWQLWLSKPWRGRRLVARLRPLGDQHW